MTEILPMNHWLLQCAFACLMLSNISWSIYYLRIILLAASVFFWLTGVLIFDVAVDTFCWNAIFGIINILRLIPLIREKCPVKLNEDQQPLFENIFADVFTKREFKRLYERCIQKRTVTVSGQQIVFQGCDFSHLIILGDVVDSGAVVELTVDKRTLFEGMPSWSWIGVLEFIAVCTKDDQKEYLGKINVTSTVTSLGVDREFVYYQLNVKQFLAYVGKQGAKGLMLKNGIFAKMLSYCTDYMRNQIEVYDQAINYEKESARQSEETRGGEAEATPGGVMNRASEVDDEMVDMSENDSEEQPLNVNP